MLLALLGATAKHNNQAFSVLPEINPVTGPEVDSVFEYSRTNTLNVRKISGGKPCQGSRHFGRSIRVQTSKPIREGTATIEFKIFPNFDHSS